MDRSLLKGAVTDVGLTDNAIGVQVSGTIADRVSYAVGVFDSEAFDSETKQVMPMARLVGHILDPWSGEYEAGNPGRGNHVDLGAAVGYLGGIDHVEDDEIVDEWNLFGVEVDLFVALGFGLTFQAEYAWFDRDFDDADKVTTAGWYAQAGYLLAVEIGPGRLEIAGRIENLDPDDDTSDDSVRGDSIGLNYYVVGHNLKIQTDCTLLDPEEGDDEVVFHIQLQLDF